METKLSYARVNGTVAYSCARGVCGSYVVSWHTSSKQLNKTYDAKTIEDAIDLALDEFCGMF